MKRTRRKKTSTNVDTLVELLKQTDMLALEPTNLKKFCKALQKYIDAANPGQVMSASEIRTYSQQTLFPMIRRLAEKQQHTRHTGVCPQCKARNVYEG